MTEAEFLKNFEAAQPLVQKICRVYAPTADGRRDLFQEIAMQAWRAWPKFRGESKFSTWLYRIGLNTALLARRKGRFATVDLEKAPPIFEHQKEIGPTEIERLYTAISQLDDGEKSIVLLFLDDLSYLEMSEVTGLTVNHVGVKLNRVRAKLRLILNAEK